MAPATTVLWLACALAACAGDEPPRPPTFVERLEALGFYAYAEPAELTTLLQQGERAGFAAIYENTGRCFRFAAQAIADGGVGRFLEELEPFLARQGIEVETEDALSDEGYSVTVNGRSYEVWTAAENEKEQAEERQGLVAAIASARAFKIVNDLLQQAGSRERLYAVQSGDELAGLFLTPTLWQLVQEQTHVPSSEKPYVPAEEYARFAPTPK